jgi:hypothetical protein
MKPVIDALTPFITYADVDVREIDLYDDAWGLLTQFPDVIGALAMVEPSPRMGLVIGLLEKIEESERGGGLK